MNTIKRLQHNNSFVAFVLVDRNNDQIAGYCFNRSFCNGKGFRGRMVDINYRGKGLGTIMNKIDKVTVVKALGMIMTIGGMIASNWTGKKEQDQTLEKLVNEKLQKH